MSDRKDKQRAGLILKRLKEKDLNIKCMTIINILLIYK